jgi:hypothetical protein
MTFRNLSALLLLSSTALFSVACGGGDAPSDEAGDGDEVSEAEAITAKVTPGTFKLYSQPHATPNPSCDVHTKLVLAANHYSTASLEEAVGGFCEIAVVPNPRTYRLRLAETACGSKIYTGSITKAGKRSTIRVTDHRSRLCRDLVPAKVVVEETRDGVTVTKYSSGASGGEQVTVTGELVRSFGIGGENTGTSIKDASGLTELVLDDGERNQFVEGKTARVKGTITYLSGVETQNRKAIDVSEMLVCPNPGWINCMPGPNVRLSNLCASENRSWVQANCPGVNYAD